MNLDLFQNINNFVKEKDLNFHKQVDNFLEELENAVNTLLKKDDGYLYIASPSKDRQSLFITACGEALDNTFDSMYTPYTKDYPKRY